MASLAALASLWSDRRRRPWLRMALPAPPCLLVFLSFIFRGRCCRSPPPSAEEDSFARYVARIRGREEKNAERILLFLRSFFPSLSFCLMGETVLSE